MAHFLRRADAFKASHGACKPCSELRLSEEPRITDAEGEGIYAQLQHVFVLSLLKMTAPANVREVAYPE